MQLAIDSSVSSVLRREITIVNSRLARLREDFRHLDAALRCFEKYDTVSRNKEEVQSEAFRQPTLEFGTGSEEDYD